MVSLSETILLTSVATVLPLVLGIFIGYLLRGASASARLPVLTAIAAGIIVWFFLDVMGSAAFLGVNEGFSGGFSQVLLVILFPIGLLTMIGLDQKSKPNTLADPAYLAALAIGLHGVAEGVAIGSGLEPAPDFLALGGIAAAVSFVVHKVLEGFAISVFLNQQKPYAKTLTATFVAGVPTILGSIIGFGLAPDTSFFFALGGGAALWLLTQLIQRSMVISKKTLWAGYLSSGLLMMYLAGLIHTG